MSILSERIEAAAYRTLASRDVRFRAVEDRCLELERRYDTLATLLRSSNTKREELAVKVICLSERLEKEREVLSAHGQDHEARISRLEKPAPARPPSDRRHGSPMDRRSLTIDVLDGIKLDDDYDWYYTRPCPLRRKRHHGRRDYDQKEA